MYRNKRFRVRGKEELLAIMERDAVRYANVRNIFLADGNALAIPTGDLLEILTKLRNHFPKAARISSYAGPKDLLRKPLEELKQLRGAGLKMLYLGVESGNETVLQQIHKGVSAREMVLAGQKAKEAGFLLSCTVILGLGGQTLSEAHAADTALVMSAIDPHYIGALTLYIEETVPLFQERETGRFREVEPVDALRELRIMVDNMELTDCVFRANHITNYLPVGGRLSRDRNMIVAELGEAIAVFEQKGIQRKTLGHL